MFTLHTTSNTSVHLENLLKSLRASKKIRIQEKVGTQMVLIIDKPLDSAGNTNDEEYSAKISMEEYEADST